MWRPLLPPACVAMLGVMGLASCGHQASRPDPVLEGRKVTSLRIVWQPSEPATAERIRRIIHDEVGGTLSSPRLDAALVALYENGLIEDCRFDAIPHVNTVELVATVVPRKPIGPDVVLFTGNTAFSDTKLGRESQLAGKRLTKEVLARAAQSVKDFYRRNGFPEAEVVVRRNTKEGYKAVFEIREGLGHR
ncbi:MAG: POTRA domain-containing protein [Luteolibacter sp.]